MPSRAAHVETSEESWLSAHPIRTASHPVKPRRRYCKTPRTCLQRSHTGRFVCALSDLDHDCSRARRVRPRRGAPGPSNGRYRNLPSKRHGLEPLVANLCLRGGPRGPGVGRGESKMRARRQALRSMEGLSARHLKKQRGAAWRRHSANGAIARQDLSTFSISPTSSAARIGFWISFP
jgi:hypothetical protein